MSAAGERFLTATRNLSEIGSPESPSFPTVTPRRHLQPSACKTHYITKRCCGKQAGRFGLTFPEAGEWIARPVARGEGGAIYDLLPVQNWID